MEERSRSYHLSLNGSNAVQHDEYGQPCEGARMGEDMRTIYRFHNGLLDGDVYGKDGKVVTTKPAIEAEGHIEYWRKGKIHRDDGLPAITADGFTINEWWQDGHRQPSPERKQTTDIKTEREKARKNRVNGSYDMSR